MMQANCIKYLGVFLDDKLNLYKHIEHLESKLSAAAGAMYKLRKFLPRHALIPAYYSLIYSHLQYAIICWGGTSKTCIRKLQVKQNLIVKILYNKFGKKTGLNPLYKKLLFLKINGIYKFEVAKFMSKVYLNKFPQFSGDHLKDYRKLSTVHTYPTRNARLDNYFVGLPKTCYIKTDQSIKVFGAKIWNNLPSRLKNKSKVSSKKIFL